MDNAWAEARAWFGQATEGEVADLLDRVGGFCDLERWEWRALALIALDQGDATNALDRRLRGAA